MTIEQILIVIFGMPTVGLLTSIFFKIGKVEAATEHQGKQIGAQGEEIRDLWSAVNKVKETLHV